MNIEPLRCLFVLERHGTSQPHRAQPREKIDCYRWKMMQVGRSVIGRSTRKQRQKETKRNQITIREWLQRLEEKMQRKRERRIQIERPHSNENRCWSLNLNCCWSSNSSSHHHCSSLVEKQQRQLDSKYKWLRRQMEKRQSGSSTKKELEQEW